MKDLHLIPNNNKFAVDDHQWRFSQTRLEYLSQKIRHTISVFQGEWFMDRKIGIPYIPNEDIQKSIHRRMIETALQVRIGEVEGVERFLSFSSSMDNASRKLSVEFTVQIDSGERYSDTVEVGG